MTVAASRLAEGAETAESLLTACLARIQAQDGALSAMRSLNPTALDEARALDQERARLGRVRSRLHGMPIAVKDNCDIAGMPTSNGNRAMAGAMPRRDAAQIARLRAAGAVIIGKTNLSEFSFQICSRSSLGSDVRNAYNPSVTAGGSSGGSAVSVAAGFAYAALGTDTGGSIRVPAAYNGLVGLRPTHGRLDMAGIAPLAPPADTVGPIARTVADSALLFQAMGGHLGPAGRRGLAGARFGVLRQVFGEDAEILEAMERALRTMAEAGAVLVDAPALPETVLPAGQPHIVDWAFAPAFDAYLATNFLPGTAPPSLAAIFASGDILPDLRADLARRLGHADPKAPEIAVILSRHRAMAQALTTLLDSARLDALIYPTSMVTPRSLDNPLGGWAPELAAMSGFPALTLPVAQAAHGPWIGLEMLGRADAEGALIALGSALEAEL